MAVSTKYNYNKVNILTNTHTQTQCNWSDYKLFLYLQKTEYYNYNIVNKADRVTTYNMIVKKNMADRVTIIT